MSGSRPVTMAERDRMSDAVDGKAMLRRWVMDAGINITGMTEREIKRAASAVYGVKARWRMIGDNNAMGVVTRRTKCQRYREAHGLSDAKGGLL